MLSSYVNVAHCQRWHRLPLLIFFFTRHAGLSKQCCFATTSIGICPPYLHLQPSPYRFVCHLTLLNFLGNSSIHNPSRLILASLSQNTRYQLNRPCGHYFHLCEPVGKIMGTWSVRGAPVRTVSGINDFAEGNLLYIYMVFTACIPVFLLHPSPKPLLVSRRTTAQGDGPVA